MDRSSSKDKAVVLILLLVALTSVYFLFIQGTSYDYLAKLLTEKANQEIVDENKRGPLAMLKYKQNTVRQKSEGGLAWRDLEIDENLYLGDQVFTQKDATSRIVFDDDSVIEMAPNTLVKITGKTGDATVDLVSGFMMAKMSDQGKSKLKLKSGDTNLELNSANAEVQISKTAQSGQKISLINGDLDLKIANQNFKLKKDEFLSLAADGTYKIKPFNIKLSNPQSGQEFYTKLKPNPVNLNWTTSKNVSEFVLALSKDPEFKNILIQKTVTSTNLTLDNLAYGTYFWRIRAIDPASDETMESQIYRFALEKDTPPKIIAPTANEVITLPLEKLESNVVVVKWIPQNVKEYEFQIVNDERILSQGKQTSNVIKLKKLKNETYQVRVRVNDPKRPDSPWSPYISFSLKELKSLEKPDLLLPQNNQEIMISAENYAPIRFQWEGDQQQSYIITVALDQNFKQPIIRKKVTGTEYIWNNKTFGSFFWRVRPTVYKYKGKLPFSVARGFSVVAKSPELYSPQDAENIILREPGPVAFEWEEIFFNKNFDPGETRTDSYYSFQVSAAENFESTIVNVKTTFANYSWKDPQFGDMYWRVKPFPKTSLGYFSSTYQFNVQKSKPPKPPAILKKIKLKIQFENLNSSASKSSPARYPAADQATFVELTWPQVEYVRAYIIEIYADRDMNELIISQEIEEPNYRWSNPAPGSFYFRVAAIDKWDQQGDFSDLSQIELSYSTTALKRPRPVSPSSNSKFPYQTNQDITNFEWSPTKYATNYKFLLAQSRDFANPILSQETTSTSYTLKPGQKGLDGKYYWKVQANYGSESFKSSPIQSIEFQKPVIAKKQPEKKKEEQRQQRRKKITRRIKKRKIIKPFAYDKIFMAHYAPTQTLYEIEATDLDGDSANFAPIGIRGYGRFSTTDSTFYEGTFTFSTGVVTTKSSATGATSEENFRKITLGGFWGKYYFNKLRWKLGGSAGLKIINISTYKRLSTTEIDLESANLFAATIRTHLDFIQSQRISHHLFGEAGFGNVLHLAGGYFLNFKFDRKQKWDWSLGSTMGIHSFNYSPSDGSEQALMVTFLELNFGMQYTF